MIAANQDVTMGQAGGGATQGKQDIAGGGVAEDIKSPYLTLEGIKGKQATLVFARMETAKDYHSPQLVLKVTMERLEAMKIPFQMLTYADGTVLRLVKISRSVDPADMPAGYLKAFMEVPLTVAGAAVGAKLSKFDIKAGCAEAFLTEAVAVAASWEKAGGEPINVKFEINASRIDPKSLKDVSILGFTANADRMSSE